MIPQNHDDLHTLAGEYVLGVLDAPDADEVAGALATNAELLCAVAFWEEQLHPVAQIIPPAEPPADLWQKIETRITNFPSKPAANRF
jgi:anti-sigma-K factor RskA